MLKEIKEIREKVLSNTVNQEDISILEKAKRYYSLLYYKGESPLSDDFYDTYIIDTLKKINPENKVLKEVGSNHLLETTLPMPCGSLVNLHYKDENDTVGKWLSTVRKSFYDSKITNSFVVSQKLDGISILVEYKDGVLSRAFKRGNGVKGQDITAHVRCMPSVPKKINDFSYLLVRGEAVMKEITFRNKYKKNYTKKGYATSRNMVAGQFTHKVPVESILKDIDLVFYEIKKLKYEKVVDTLINKVDQLKMLADHNFKVAMYSPIHLENCLCDTSPSRFDVNDINDIFKSTLISYKRESPYLMDGIVIDCNYSIIREKLGFETNSINPKYARSFKMRTEEDEYTTVVEKIEWNVSKNGLVKPRVIFKKIDINGVSVTAATGKNARTIIKLGLGKGAVIKVTRSGDAIPDILETVEKAAITGIIVKCPVCNAVLEYTETGADLCCPNKDCVGMVNKRILAFFRTIDVEYVNEGIINKCIEAGYNTFDKILQMNIKDFEKLDRVGNKNAVKIYNSIRNACKNVSLSTLMHATGFFGKSLGSTKLELVIDYLGEEETLKLSELEERKICSIIEHIKGFAKLSAVLFVAGIKRFTKWYSRNLEYFKDSVKDSVKDNISSNVEDLQDLKVVFSGFRDKILEKKIKKGGGKVVTSISSTITHLIVKDKNSSSSKVKKAMELGIEVVSLEEFLKKIT